MTDAQIEKTTNRIIEIIQDVGAGIPPADYRDLIEHVIEALEAEEADFS